MNTIKRSKKDRIISGVCGGIGEYFNIDPTLIRLGYMIFIFISFGTGLLVYFIASLIIPEDGDEVIYQDNMEDEEYYNQEKYEQNERTRKNTILLLGTGFIILGIFLVARNIFPSIFYQFRFLWNLWPLLFIVLGVYMIYQQKNK